MNKVYMHLDIDAFFASVEQHDNPEYRNRPVIVGADPGGRGVVAACSYEARAFGVHSAMPISMARQRCPQAVFLPVRMQRYQEISGSIMQYLKDCSPRMHQVSIDEAFLDYSGTERILGSPRNISEKLKADILHTNGIHVSIGIGSNPYIAKLASASAKPSGILQIHEDEIIPFIDSLPLRKLWGLGPKTLEQLNQFNISTAEQLRRISEADLASIFGSAGAARLYRIARGIDPGVIHELPQSRSISTEHTFAQDTNSMHVIHEKLFELCHTVMFRMLNEGFASSTVFVRVRSAQFETHSTQKTMPKVISSSQELFETAKQLLQPLAVSAGRVRLIGVGLGKLSEDTVSRQSDLFPEKHEKQGSVEAAILQLRRKYGSKSITKADLLQPKPNKPNE
ncbi:MAG: DNA polymerase IV [Spirochaeta sp.]